MTLTAGSSASASGQAPAKAGTCLTESASGAASPDLFVGPFERVAVFSAEVLLGSREPRRREKLFQFGANPEKYLRQRMKMLDGCGVDSDQTALHAFEAAAGARRVPGEDMHAFRVGSHDHLRHVITRCGWMSAA